MIRCRISRADGRAPFSNEAAMKTPIARLCRSLSRSKLLRQVRAVLLVLAGAGAGTLSGRALATALRPQQEYRDYARSHTGDPAAGRLLFEQRSCVRCHGLPGESGGVGPDLAGIGRHHDREFLITSILDPSASVATGYGTITLVTHEGEMLFGKYLKEGPEGVTMELNGKPRTVPYEDIETHKLNSFMPSGLEQTLTLQQFADMVAYLEKLK
jgi:putative heme-binding domain-containing protein